jgi:hypothetical protein
MSIREMIDEYRNKIKDASSLEPDQASRYIVELSSIMGNVNQELLAKQMLYNEAKLKCLDEEKSVARAAMKAETTDAYRAYQEVKGYRDLLVEMIRGLKYYLRSQDDENSFGKYQ